MTGEPHDPYGDEDLITVTQAAKLLRVLPTELMTAVNAGEVPHYLHLGRLWFSRSELFERLNRSQGPSAAPPRGSGK